ncbi:MAG: hypothetical protein ABI876_16075 [Bacteroidota bacterium]
MTLFILFIVLAAIFGPSRKEFEARKAAEIRHDDSVAAAKATAELRQHRQDSITRQTIFDALPKGTRDSVIRARKDSIAAIISDSVRQESEKRKFARACADSVRRANIPVHYEAPATETYNGHVIYTGPRGGRYYINGSGNKTYIH